MVGIFERQIDEDDFFLSTWLQRALHLLLVNDKQIGPLEQVEQ